MIDLYRRKMLKLQKNREKHEKVGEKKKKNISGGRMLKGWLFGQLWN